MSPGNPFDPELLNAMQAVTQALVAYLPQHFKSGYCVIQQAEGHALGRLRYEIGSDENPGESTTQPSAQLHDAAYGLYRLWTKDKAAFPGARVSVAEQPDGQWKCDVKRLEGEDKPAETDEEREKRWDEVYRAREAFFTEHFGPLPNEIQKLMNLMGVWPAGGLYTFEATKRGGLGISTTFGLSNYDMPTSVAIQQYERTQNEAGQPTFKSSLQARVPRWVAPDWAGYGYEVLILTPKPETWPLLPLSWFAQMEILKDVNLPGRVQEYEGLTVESVKIGDGSRSADFFVTPALPPLPPAAQLPNGTMRLLVATRITREEMNFSLEKGRPALLERLQKAGVGQISDLGRSVV
jgi:hypothetical protein